MNSALAITLLLLAGAAGVGPAAGETGKPPVVFHVATNGNDSWSGRLPEPNRAKTDGPFATITRARDAIRQLKVGGGLNAPVEVRLRGGVY
ncbi:MAG TPA: right-handed parallel beta-helix repeat-containing protein, partial [Armatimonadota bacterium]|nr:right-handed parallel beta-helix repeat-containing protein [Armatimonadota bacterium]